MMQRWSLFWATRTLWMAVATVTLIGYVQFARQDAGLVITILALGFSFVAGLLSKKTPGVKLVVQITLLVFGTLIASLSYFSTVRAGMKISAPASAIVWLIGGLALIEAYRLPEKMDTHTAYEVWVFYSLLPVVGALALLAHLASAQAWFAFGLVGFGLVGQVVLAIRFEDRRQSLTEVSRLRSA